MGPPAPAVVVQDLAKTFRTGWFGRRRLVALGGLSFSVPVGTVFGILGPNGAGKTTLLSILATLLVPDHGTVRVLGLDAVRDAHRLRARINMASGGAAFLWSLSPRDILDVTARSYGLPGPARRARVGELLARFEMEPHATTPYNELSSGLKQRLALAKAFVNDPELLILDEPTVGLDPDVAARIREQIAALRRERAVTILLSTHYMKEAEALCDDIAFLRDGRIIARGDAGSLRREIVAGERIVLGLTHPEGSAGAEGLRHLPGVLAYRGDGERVECVVDDARKRLPEVLRHLVERRIDVHHVTVREPDLESVFLELAR